MNYIEQISNMAITYAPKVIGAIVTLIIGFWLIKRITLMVQKSLDKGGIDPTIRPFLTSMVNVGLKIILIMTAASMFGVETTSFVAIFSTLVLAIGLGLQGSLGHFASGVLLLIFKPYKVGDLVEIAGDKKGTVEGIQIFNTVMRTLDNKLIIVPNGLVTSNIITNISGQDIIGVELTYAISYTANIDIAREAILKVGKECPFILDEPRQGVVVATLGASSVSLATRPFAKSEHYWDAYFYMQENVKKELEKVGVTIPFPQMEVRVHQQ